MNAVWVERGDTFFTRSNTLLGKLIRWGETEKDEELAWTNHTGVVVESGWVGHPCKDEGGAKQAIVVEALWKTRRGPLKINGTAVRFFRPIPAYTWGEKELFCVEAETYVGNTYGWWKLIGFLLLRLTRGVIDLTKIYRIKSRPICSYLAAHVNEAARKRGTTLRVVDGIRIQWPGFGVPSQSADPDEMMDFCEAYPEYWQEVKG